MSTAVTVVPSGGLAVTIATTGYGVPVTAVTAGGLAVTIRPSGGLPVVGGIGGSDVGPNYSMLALGRTFALTGQSATLTYTPAQQYSMQAGVGSFVFTGEDMTPITEVGVSGEEAETGLWVNAVVAASGTVSTTQRTNVDTLIKAYKAAGVWTLLDSEWLFASESRFQATIDIKGLRSMTPVNGVKQFTPGRGYKENGFGGYFDLGFAPSAGGNFQRNAASFGCYSLTSRTTDNSGSHMGSTDGAASWCFMRARNNGGVEHCINDTNFNTPANADAQGNYIICRTNSTTIIPYKNNAAMPTGTTAATQPLPTYNWFVFCHNGGATGASPGTLDEIASAFIGGAMTGTQALAKNAALNDYMTAQGCNVYNNPVAYSLQAGAGAFALSGKDATLTKTAAPGYTGPGDLTSGAVAWFGLRAYNAAYAAPGTNPCMRITDSGGLGSNEVIINILPTGLLDYATLNAWIAAHGSPYVYQLYDQTGNGNHMVSAGAMSGRPRIVVSPPGLTTGRAALVFDGSLSSQIGAAVGTPVTTQPITVSMVCNRTAGTTGARSGLFAGAGSNPRFGYENGANTFFMYAGSSLLSFGTTANNTWYGVQAIYNDPSGSRVNYTSVAGGTVITGTQAVGTSSFGGGFVVGVSGGGDAFTGYVTEIGGWSGFVAAGMGANQIASL